MPPFGATATPTGVSPTAIVVTTALVAVSITDTVSEFKFVTYTRAQ
jgi:hypothetical protein